MRAVRDTFFQYIADNQQYPAWYLRKDPNNPKHSQLKEGAVNIQFIADDPAVSEAKVNVSIDVVNADELTAIDMMKAVWNVLAANAMAPLKDYTNPNAPAALQGNVFWKPDSIRFRPVATDTYFRYNSQLTLSYFIQ